MATTHNKTHTSFFQVLNQQMTRPPVSLRRNDTFIYIATVGNANEMLGEKYNDRGIHKREESVISFFFTVR